MQNNEQMTDGQYAHHKRTVSASNQARKTVPRIYEVVVQCRDEREQRVVYERMRVEGFRCRVLTL